MKGVILATTAVLVCLARAALGAEAGYTRQYESAGLKVEAGFVPDRTEIASGEPTFVSFCVKNLGDKEIRLPAMGERAKRSSKFSITAINAAGNKVKDPLEKDRSGGGMMWLKTIAPGEEATYRLFLPQRLEIAVEGTYRVSCRTDLELAKPAVDESDVFRQGNTEKIPIATEFQLTVTPRDERKAKEIIERFGASVSSSDPMALREAILALSAIDDERVVPYLIAAVQRRNVPNLERAGQRGLWVEPAIYQSYPYLAIEGLGKFRDTKAQDALLAIICDSPADSSTRAAAAAALAATKCSAAVLALIQALDATQELPGAAARALGEIGDRSAIEPLKKRLDHADMRTRLTIVEALYALGEPFNEDWVKPIIQSKNANEFDNAAWFVLRHAGWEAPRILAECLDMADASTKSYYNYTLVWKIAVCGGPKLTYNHDFDGKATEEQLAQNRATLDAMKAWLDGQKALQ